ncbi:MAG: hypothetical protein QOC82_1740 [Frankiaceae bacterium]|jgi:hypothetical protein|nr:hypothetical protein [Frankiaceae bacterium]
MPTTVVGLLVFVLLLVPGLAHHLILERHGSTRRLSTFRETVAVAFVSVLSLGASLGGFAVIRTLWPSGTPDVGSLIRCPRPYFNQHYGRVFAWAIGLLALATVLAVLAASPRFRRLLGWFRARKVVKWMLPPPRSNFASGWTQLFEIDRPDHLRAYVGCTLDDGTYFGGWLRSWNRDSEDTPDRELTLTGAITYKRGKKAVILPDVKGMILSARQIHSLRVSYLRPDVDVSKTVPTEPARSAAKRTK